VERRKVQVGILVLLFGLGVAALGCGFFGGDDKKDDGQESLTDDEPTIEEVLTTSMKNTTAFAGVSGQMSEMPMAALPAAALPAAMTSSSSSALPAAALPAAFESGDDLPEIPPSSAFSADMSGFIGGYFLKAMNASIRFPTGTIKISADVMTDVDDFVDQMKMASDAYGQAKLVLKLAKGIMYAHLDFSERLLKKIDFGLRTEKVKLAYFQNAALVYFFPEGEVVEYEDAYAGEGDETKTVYTQVKLIIQAAKDVELPVFGGMTRTVADFTPTHEMVKAERGLIWSLLVSGVGPRIDVDNFVLMNGVTSLDGKKGVWQVFDPVKEKVTRKLQLTYHHHSDSYQVSKIELNAPDAARSTMYYRKSELLTFFRFHNATNDVDYVIFKDASGSSEGGFIKVNDNERQCWEEAGEQDDNCNMLDRNFANEHRLELLAEDPLFPQKD